MNKLDQILFDCHNYKYDLKIINTQKTKKYCDYNKHNIQIKIQEKDNNLFWDGSIYINDTYTVYDILKIINDYKLTKKTERIIFPSKVFESQKINIIFKTIKSTIVIPCDQINDQHNDSKNAQTIYRAIEKMNKSVNEQNEDIKNKITKMKTIYLISLALIIMLFTFNKYMS